MRNPFLRIREMFRRGRRAGRLTADGPVGFDEGGPARALVDPPPELEADGVVTDEERAALLGAAPASVHLHEEDEAQADAAPIVPLALPTAEEVTPADLDALRQQRVVEGIGQLGELLSRIRSGLEAQHGLQERLVQQLEGLPEALNRLPALAGQQLQVLEALQHEIAATSSHTAGLAEAFRAFPEAACAQTALLQKMNDQLAAHSLQGQQMVKSLGDMQEWLGEMSEATRRQLRCLEDMDSARRHEAGQIVEVLRSQSRRTAALFVTAAALSALALAGVVVIGSLVAKLW